MIVYKFIDLGLCKTVFRGTQGECWNWIDAVRGDGCNYYIKVAS